MQRLVDDKRVLELNVTGPIDPKESKEKKKIKSRLNRRYVHSLLVSTQFVQQSCSIGWPEPGPLSLPEGSPSLGGRSLFY